MKEQATEEASNADALPRWQDRPQPQRASQPAPGPWQKALVPGLFIALALLATTGYGSGLQFNDGQPALHIDPLKFLQQLLHAWNPSVGLGTHTGYWYPYETPYAWAYGLAALAHVSQELAQRLWVFVVYLGCLVSMYYCLRSVAPWLNETARIAGSCAYLFNLYVALNSQAQIVWLLTYATLPALVGITARAMRGEMKLWRAALGVALLVLVGAGVNPPLVAINAIVIAIFVVVTIAFDPNPRAALRRALPFVVAASVATIAINFYWLAPFVEFFRGVWLNGVLSEAPSMHNADTSFYNVLRGLGHWATFVSFDNRPYFPWAPSYAAGFFSAALWLVPIVALAGVALRQNQRLATLYFLLVTVVSVPLVVGYYKDPLGHAITSPIYDVFFRDFPGFQMFRFSYKWVAGVEFGICGLYALSTGAIAGALRQRVSELAAPVRDQVAWVVPAFGVACVVLPIVLFVPVLEKKTNYPGPVIPSWEHREAALLGDDQRFRVALFPTQYLEQFDWGAPEFYIEDSLISRPIVYGLLGGEPSEGSDHWIRGAYRATRSGLPFSPDMFAVLNVDTILQRDDFIPAIDFSFPELYVLNSTTLTHDLLHRVLGAQPVRSDGPLRVYHLTGALPLVYGVDHPSLSSLPPFTNAYLGDVRAMARGAAEFTMPSRPTQASLAAVRSLSPIFPETATQVRDLAVEQVLAEKGIRINPPSGDITLTTPFTVKSSGRYAVFAREQSPLFFRPAPTSLQVGDATLSPQIRGGAWTSYGYVDLDAGDHAVSDGFPDPDLIVAIVKPQDLRAWETRIAAVQSALPGNLSSTRFVNALQTRVLVPRPGNYRLEARAALPLYWQDSVMRAHLLRAASDAQSFLTGLSSTLPYIFGSGVFGTKPLMMPEAWYRSDPSVYRWSRGDQTSWFLFTRDGHVRVFVPGSSDIRARVRLHVSRLQISPLMHVTVDGRPQLTLTLPGPPAGTQAYDTEERLSGPTSVLADFTLRLHPGWNDVAFGFDALASERDDLGSDVISAAVGPDLSFTRIGSIASAAKQTQPDADVNVVALAPPPGLYGDPEIKGGAALSGAKRTWLAVALKDRKGIAYRIFPTTREGTFQIDFLHAFPNSWTDESKRVVGMWFVARGTYPVISNIYYTLHGVPTTGLLDPHAFSSLPVRVDGKRVGARPIFLSAGEHLVENADRQLKIERLTVAPANLPKTRSFSLDWTRRSPTELDVAVKDVTRPFLLVFGEAYHPQWQASINGRPLTHVVVDGLTNGWIVPSLQGGNATVVLAFESQRSYAVAAIISLVSLIVIVALAYAPVRRRFARSS